MAVTVPTQTAAANTVGSAFSGATPTGLTPPQAAAYAGVQAAFAPAPAAPPAPTSPPVVTPPGGTTPPVTNRSVDTSTDPSNDPTTPEGFLNTFTPPQTADQIAEQKRTAAQGLIDSTNKTYDDQVAAERKAGQGRLDANNSVSVLSGLMGSTEAVRTSNEVGSANDKAVQAINNQRAAQLASIYSKISDDATNEAEQQKQDATKSAEDILARRTQVQTDAVANVTNMAKTGLVDFNSFSTNPQNAAVYQHALDSVGGSVDALKGIFAVNRPQDSLVGTPQRVGDHFIQGYKNAITGKVSYDTISVPGLGAEYSSFQKMGDNLVAIPDGWNGDVSQLKTIAGQPSKSDLLDQQYKQAQIDNLKATTSQKTSASAGGGVSDALQQAITNGTIDPNRINSRTLGIYNDLATAQVDAAGSHAGIAGNTKAFEDATRYATTATRVVGVLDKNMPLLASLADKVNQTGVPGLDNYINGVKAYTGNNQDVVKYVSTLKTLRSEYAQMLSKGNAATESDKAEAAQAIPAGLSGDNYLSLQKQLQLEGQNIIDTANSTKNSLFSSTQSKNAPTNSSASGSNPLGI